MRLANFSVKNSLLINLLSVFIILVGFYCMCQMNREAFPSVSYDIVTVTTVYPGAPSEDVEKLVTIPLEKEIKGIVKLPLPDIDNKIVYLPLDICQGLFNAGDNLTSLALALHDTDDKAISKTVEKIRAMIPADQRVMEWREMNEVMVSQMEADNKGGMIMLGILYLVIAFGVFGTVLMLTSERRREFGVLVAIGMQKKKLASIMTLEMFLVGLIGILAGALVASIIILYGVEHPMVFKGETAKMFEDYGFEPKMVFWSIDTYYIWQMVIVGLMVLIAIGYPMRKIFGMKVVNALRA